MQTIPVGTRVWKKALHPDYLGSWRWRSHYVLVEMEVVEEGFVADYETYHDNRGKKYPAGHNELKKGRVRAARVVSLTSFDGKPVGIGISEHSYENGGSFDYTVDKLVVPEQPFDEGNWACGSGIHCFLNKEDAEEYVF